MTLPGKVRELVERFDRNIEAYKHGKYNETQVRREFLDPMLDLHTNTCQKPECRRRKRS